MKRTDVVEQAQAIRNSMDKVTENLTDVDAVAWVVIDAGHAGTIDNPIPAARGMEYEYGKYYLDPEDSKTYLCKRGEETGSIVLYYLPHELIGQYFEEVS